MNERIRLLAEQAGLKIPVDAEYNGHIYRHALEKFAKLGVTKEMIEKRIQRRYESLTPALMVQLGRIYTSLEDNMSETGEWFEVEAPPEKEGGDLKSRLKAKKGDKAPAPCPNTDPPEVKDKAFCDACINRLGCPAWAETDSKKG